MIAEHAVDEETARKLIGQLVSVEVSSLAFCRLLERWRSGEADPSTPGRRQAALRRAADRVETALAGLERPLGRYLLELEADHAEGRSWFGEPGPAELVDWEPVLDRAGVHVAPHRVASRLPRAGGARAGARGPLGAGAVALVDRQELALGRPVRPAREPARPRARRPPSDRRLAPRPLSLRDEPLRDQSGVRHRHDTVTQV